MNIFSVKFNGVKEKILPPIDKNILKRDLNNAQLLGKTQDNFSIHLADFSISPNLIKEIARLREITFRSVGEGTGKAIDIDNYDEYYKHIVLWNITNDEIAGSYRIGICDEILIEYGREGLYSSSTCHLTEGLLPLLERSLDMGRSFIQEQYWRTNALDYLWQGIGALIKDLGNIRYLCGSVSISDSYPEIAKKLIVFYYKKWFLADIYYAIPSNEYTLKMRDIERFNDIFTGRDHKQDLLILKSELNKLNASIPVLFRKYTELCEYGGVKIINFNVDMSFFYFFDAFILVDLELLKPTYAKRYFSQRSFL